MTLNNWTRIPAPIEAEQDRRTICAILAEAGLAVRIVRIKVGTSNSAPRKRFVEYQE